MKVNIKPERCKECRLCTENCPKQAISHAKESNAAGYHPVVIDEAKCIVCGICYTVCPDGVYQILNEEG